MKDLVVLVPDSDFHAAVSTLLRREESLGIPSIQADVFVHPRRDPGVFLEAPQFLRDHLGSYSKALAMFDYEGCGREESPEELRFDLKERLVKAGWPRDDCEVVVLVPELEAWVWSPSPVVSEVLKLDRRRFSEILRDGKPTRPKEAMEECLRSARIPRSSSLYAQLAERVSLRRCSDEAFLEFRRALKRWFGS